MERYDYLVVGASHAGLEAVRAIRAHDATGSIAMLNRDPVLPYSPTVLPYVVSGRSKEDRVALRDHPWFESLQTAYLERTQVSAVDAAKAVVRCADGKEIGYGKLLLATGAKPIIPPVSGLDGVPYHVLRTLDDALALRNAMGTAKHAVVLGAGLVGMHAAENLAKGKCQVTVVEMRDQVLPGYFDAEAAAMISAAFTGNGVEMLTKHRVTSVAKQGQQCVVKLENGEQRIADLLLVATGVTPEVDFLKGALDIERGIIVDEFMRTRVANVWAAGDVVQTRSFFGDGTPAGGILPDAVEQGRTAGMDMAGDPGVTPYPGGIPLNTYNFFGNRALSVGRDLPANAGTEWEVLRRNSAASASEPARYLKIVLRDNCLQGIFGVNVLFDPGIMWELILRRTNLSELRQQLLDHPQDTARAVMSGIWR
ncbi:MAG: FAD-dependent oxidoreductase [Betaproteobacteria bacterium]|nr:FAD-dependent oxidoreductase [Betaproteobacteria bacterium]